MKNKIFICILSTIPFIITAQIKNSYLFETTNELEEIVISVNKEAQKSKWRKYNTRSKKSDTWFLYLFPSEVLLTSVEIQEPTEFNGIRLYINNSNPINEKVNLKPYVLINSNRLDDNLLYDNFVQLSTIESNGKPMNIDIEFKNSISLTTNDILTIGIELITNSVENNSVLSIQTTNKLSSKSNTYRIDRKKTDTIQDQNESQKIYDTSSKEILFELKSVK